MPRVYSTPWLFISYPFAAVDAAAVCLINWRLSVYERSDEKILLVLQTVFEIVYFRDGLCIDRR